MFALMQFYMYILENDASLCLRVPLQTVSIGAGARAAAETRPGHQILDHARPRRDGRRDPADHGRYAQTGTGAATRTLHSR